MEVEYDSGIACGKVLLWCWIHFQQEDIVDQSYAMIQTLTGKGKKLAHISICQSYDSFTTGPHQFQFVPGSAIKSVAYVLPCIDHNDTNRTTFPNYFHNSLDCNRHFMVIKPVELWS